MQGSTATAKRRDQQAWSREELLANARALVPAMRERALDCEKNRTVSEETIDDFHRNGLVRVIQPAWAGGSETDFTTYLDVCSEIAKGCASSAWVLTNLASHHFMLAYWPPEAQHELWDNDPDVLIASGLAFQAGKAQRVDGGYRISGKWPFSSGVNNSTWNMLGAMLPPEDDPDGAPVGHLFLVPESDYTILDTWHVTGLAGTGSNHVAADDIFVPQHRAITVPEIVNQTTPGLTLNPGTLFKLPFFPMFPFVVGCVTTGIAQGTVEGFTQVSKSRASTYTGKSLADLDPIQARIGEATAAADAGSILLQSTSDDVYEKTAAGHDFSAEDKARIRLKASYATQQSVKAVDVLYAAGGGGALAERNPLQRAFRDAHATIAHIHLNWDALSRSYGRAALGLPTEGNL